MEVQAAELKAARKAFALQQFAKLKEMGFGEKAAWAIMRAAGPGRAVAAAEWAAYAMGQLSRGDKAWLVAARDALDCLLDNPGGTCGFGKARMEEALRVLGLEPPEVGSSTALFKTLRGAHAAVSIGGVLPFRENAEAEAT